MCPPHNTCTLTVETHAVFNTAGCKPFLLTGTKQPAVALAKAAQHITFLILLRLLWFLCVITGKPSFLLLCV